MILRLFRKTKNKELLLAALVLAAAFFIFLGLPLEKATVKPLEQPREYQAKKEPTEESIIYKKKQEVLETASTDTSKGQRIESALKNKELSLVERSGNLTAIRASGASDNIYFFEEGGVKKELLFSKEPKEPIPSQRVTISGLATDTEIIVATEGDVSLAGSLKANPVTGARSVLVIVHNFSDVTFATNRDQNGNLYTPDDSISTANLTGIMSTNSNSVRNFYQEASYGALSLNVTVTSVLTSAHSFTNFGCSQSALPSISLNARDAAVAYSPGSFNHIIYVFPFSHLCTFEDSIYAGVAEWPGNEVWINGNMNAMVYAHELGHNYGLGHANYNNCGTQIIGTNCTSVEYGDFFDTMGSTYAHFNASMKEHLGWLSGGRIQAVSSSGIFTIHPMSSPENNLKALKIPIGTTGRFYYIEYRQPTGFDFGLPVGGTRGAQIRIGSGDNTNTNILDMTPTGVFTSANLQDVAMTDGQIFNDTANNIRITQISASGVLSVRVEHVQAFNIRNLPITASLGFSNLDPAAGETINKVFSIRNTSSLSATFDAAIANINTQTGQWNSSPHQTITLAPGETRQLQFSNRLLHPGPNRSWISIRIGGVWYDALPLTNQQVSHSYFVRIPNIRLNHYFFSQAPPIAGRLFSANVSITNLELNPIHLDALGVPVFRTNDRTWHTMNSNLNNINILPGQTIERSFTQTLNAGHYRIWPSIGISGHWFTPRDSRGVERFWQGDVR